MPTYIAHKSIDLMDAVVSDSIEALTGSDIFITPQPFPVTTEKLIQKHLDAGAIMIQIKTGQDIVASLGPRMNTSIARMTSLVAAPFQRLLLFVGMLDSTPAGYAIINGDVTSHLYVTVAGALDSWIMRGGTVMFLKNMNMLPEYIYNKEKKMLEMLAQQKKEVYPPPLQWLVNVYDWRLTIVTFPMIGEARAKKIRDYLVENRLGDSLIQALVVMTDRKYSMKDTLSETIRLACRGWLGLPDGWNIDLKPEDDDTGE